MNDKPIEITGVTRDASGAPVLHYTVKCEACGKPAEGFEQHDGRTVTVYCVKCMLHPTDDGVAEASAAAFAEDGRFRPVILRSDEPDSMYVLNTLCDTADAAIEIAQSELLRSVNSMEFFQ